MDLIADNVDGVVVLNVSNVCTGLDGQECKGCVDIGGLIHNWMMGTEVRYVVFDFQDEKDLCRTFLVEILQLRKRLRVPFMFSGVMDRPKRILLSYAVDGEGKDIFTTPEDAVSQLKKQHTQIAAVPLSGITFGEPIVSLKARQLQRAAEEQQETTSQDDL